MNASNTNGETAMDILAQGPRDMNDQEIKRCLMRAGETETKKENFLRQIPQNPRSQIGDENMRHYDKPQLKKESKNNDDWLDKKRNTLMVVASLIATMAFQAGTNPPSGVWQDNSIAQAGSAVMLYNHPNYYHTFLVCNTA
ncbi:putative PGG domain-containing protein [Helianthus anomalus]